MPKKCVYSVCTYNQFGGGYCKSHQYLRTDKKRNVIRQFSEKRSAVNGNEYGPKSREFIKRNPGCRILSPVCTRNAACVNHKKGKATIELLLDERYWEASCFPCNGYIEDNDAWAREHGHKVSRHSNN